jgi:hypothetical protein
MQGKSIKARMFTFFAFLMIFLETSLSMGFPYNVFSIAYTNYIMYEKQESGFYHIFFVALLVSLSGNSIEKKMLFFGVYSLVVYHYSKYILYEKFNIPLISTVQVLLYAPYVYFFELKLFSLGILIKMFIFYLVANFLYLQKSTLNRS